VFDQRSEKVRSIASIIHRSLIGLLSTNRTISLDINRLFHAFELDADQCFRQSPVARTLNRCRSSVDLDLRWQKVDRMKKLNSYISPTLIPLLVAAMVLSPLESEARNPPRGPDFDCDGYDDMVIGTPYDDDTVGNGGGINVLYGSASGPTAPGLTTLRFDQATTNVEGTAAVSDYFGYGLAWGDFDGDGYDDVGAGVIGEDVNGDGSAGAVNVLYGGSSGLSATGDQIWHGDSVGITAYDATANDFLGDELAAGDFDDDGYDDLAVTAREYDPSGVTGAGGVLILYGSASGLTATGHQILHQGSTGMAGDGNQSGDGWGYSLVTGDFDCDGYDDLAVGDPWEEITGYAGFNHGAVTVIYGSASGLSTTGSQWWHQGVGAIEGAVESDHFGISLAAANFDGDSSSDVDCVDLAIGANVEAVGAVSSNGAVNIIYGSSSGLTDSGDQILYQGNGLTGSVAASSFLGSDLTVGRFTSDSYDDLAIGAHGASPSAVSEAGEIYLAKGSATGLTATGSVRWDQASTNIPGTREADDWFSSELSYAAFEGDAGDHYLVVGASQEDADEGAVSTIQLDSSTSNLAAQTGGFEWKQDDIEGTNGVEFFSQVLPSPRVKGRTCIQ
jgi:hypothetical protein